MPTRPISELIGTTIQGYTARLQSLGGLDYTGNGLRAVRVNLAADGFEFATYEPALATGTTSQFLRGDKTWAEPPGGGAGPNVTAFAGGAGPALGTTEATIGAVSLTGVPAGTPVLILARVSLLKDGGTTVRTATIRVRRGSLNTDTQIGRDCGARSQGVASSDYGPGVIMAIDSAHPGGNLTYTVRGLASGASTTPNYELTAIPLTMAA